MTPLLNTDPTNEVCRCRPQLSTILFTCVKFRIWNPRALRKIIYGITALNLTAPPIVPLLVCIYLLICLYGRYCLSTVPIVNLRRIG